MIELNLDAIAARLRLQQTTQFWQKGTDAVVHDVVAEDIAALIAEVEMLRARVEEQEKLLDLAGYAASEDCKLIATLRDRINYLEARQRWVPVEEELPSGWVFGAKLLTHPMGQVVYCWGLAEVIPSTTGPTIVRVRYYGGAVWTITHWLRPWPPEEGKV